MSVIFELEAPYRGFYRLHRLSFGRAGRSVALVAGIHGNEVNGTHALNLVAGVLRTTPVDGVVHLIPCVNTAGADENRKRWPFDDRDILSAFPGDPDGLPVERIAAAVLDASRAEVCVDVHSGAPAVHELPHLRIPRDGPAAELARASGLPVVWRRGDPDLAEGLVGAWRREGRVAMQLRGGRGGALDGLDAEAMAWGVLRILGALGVVPPRDPGGPVLDVERVDDHRTEHGGFFVPAVEPGARVGAGTRLGTVRNPVGGEVREEVVARREGVVLAVRVYPMVHARELVARVVDGPVIG